MKKIISKDNPTLTEPNVIIALCDMGGTEAILYAAEELASDVELITDYTFRKRQFTDKRLFRLVRIIPSIKKMKYPTEWYLVNENGTYYSKGDNSKD